MPLPANASIAIGLITRAGCVPTNHFCTQASRASSCATTCRLRSSAMRCSNASSRQARRACTASAVVSRGSKARARAHASSGISVMNE
jgi:hypothetical protein